MKTKAAYLVRYSPTSSMTDVMTAGRNLRTKEAARRALKIVKKAGFKDAWLASITVSADSILRK